MTQADFLRLSGGIPQPVSPLLRCQFDHQLPLPDVIVLLCGYELVGEKGTGVKLLVVSGI